MDSDRQAAPTFPAPRLPAPGAAQRLVGLYPQRQEGFYMQRVRVPGGSLSPQQWRTLAAAARQFTPQTPLHLTTRQTLEFHDLTEERIPALHALLASAGLTTVGTCGDTLRNVTVCPCAALRSGTCELLDLAERIRHLLQASEGAFALPRKFKISLSACDKACAQPFINDVGLIARQRDGRWGFEVIIAGSLGARPGLGIRLYEWIPPEEVLPLTLAAMRVFAAEGDRQNRHKARLRHVRERLGDSVFVGRINEAFAAAKAERDWPALELGEVSEAEGLNANAILTFANGDVTPEMAEALGELAGQEGLAVRNTGNHRVVVYAKDATALHESLLRQPALREASRAQPVIVACPGNRWCARGLCDTDALADRIRRELSHRLPPGKMVCISGCPNGCAHSAVGHIGLSGGQTTLEDGTRVDAYSLSLGGGMGRTDQLAETVARKLTSEQVVAEIAARL